MGALAQYVYMTDAPRISTRKWATHKCTNVSNVNIRKNKKEWTIAASAVLVDVFFE